MNLNADLTRILVVDDSALYRQSIQNVLRDVAGATTVGWASNGLEALEKIEQLDPDLLTLDVQMPDMDGISVLQEIKSRRLRPKAIMVSSLTASGTQVTTDALMEGAFDFILKPASNDSVENRRTLRDALQEKIGAFRDSVAAQEHGVRSSIVATESNSSLPVPTPNVICRAVILATSTGGPQALKTVLPKLPANLQVPICVVQHMPANFTRSLAERLNEICELEVVEAVDDMEVTAGRVIIAAGGKQMKLERRRSGLRMRVTDDPPENGVRPAADYLLRSATDAVDGNALAVIMTGMGRDGLEGCRQLKELGGFVFSQTQEDCVVYGMSKAVITNNLADRVLPLGKIAPAIVRHVKRSQRT